MTEKAARDALLMAGVAAGDSAAFGTLMQVYMPRAYRAAYRLVNSASDSQDLAQEAMLRVWRHAETFNPERASFAVWFYRIVTHLAFDRLRQQRRAGEHWGLEAAAEVADQAPGAEALMIAQAERQRVAAALARLPERQRAVVVLVHYEGLSGREAAEALSMTAKAVESLLHRAMKTLRLLMMENEHIRGAH
jgi:RNA polymerase sigma-70 factor (ECF subfamily)